MYGPPGTGKTLLARACAAQTDATFLKLAGPQLVQMFIGDGAKLVRDCFALAKEKAPAIIFIDELDAVGTKRFDSEKSGDREVQRTMLELLNQLDGFASDDRIKVLAATNRVDVLDPALLRSGRLDRKIEFPLPNEEARAQILKIHSRKMKVDPGVNWGELARSTDEFGGAMLKAVCVEAGMIALRSGKNKIGHEHYVDAIAEVQAKKKDVSPHTVEATKTELQLITICRRSTSMREKRVHAYTSGCTCPGAARQPSRSTAGVNYGGAAGHVVSLVLLQLSRHSLLKSPSRINSYMDATLYINHLLMLVIVCAHYY
jgi:26S proteasome regulatory subunit T5